MLLRGGPPLKDIGDGGAFCFSGQLVFSISTAPPTLAYRTALGAGERLVLASDSGPIFLSRLPF
jgi:hypothetical protein